MKYRLSLFAVLVAAIVGVNVSRADDQSDGARAGSMHYTFDEWAYFTGNGFKSHLESYAEQDKAAATVDVPMSEEMPTGHTYTIPEYLYFTGRGFTSRNN